MKSKNLINLAMGGFISLFGGLNSLEAQEREKIDSILNAKLENIESISDYETYGIKGYAYWQTPEETAERGAGNCFDLSNYCKDGLDKHGIESQIALGKREKSDTVRHGWIETPKYVIECTNGGKIYDKDSIKNEGKYLSSNTHTKHVTDKVIDYYNRTGEILDIKGFEPLRKVLQLRPSPKF